MSARAPDLTEKVLGFRTFRVADGGFCSVGIGLYHWLPGPNRARCLASGLGRPPTTHSAPVFMCGCGLYGFHVPRPGWDGGVLAHPTLAGPVLAGPARPVPQVAAAILAWGRMKIHRDGFRAEYAEIALVGYDPLIGLRAIAETQEVAQVYGVRAASIEEFEEQARLLGRPVPERLLPEQTSVSQPPYVWPSPRWDPSAAAAAYAAAYLAPDSVYPPEPKLRRTLGTKIATASLLTPVMLYGALAVFDWSPVFPIFGVIYLLLAWLWWGPLADWEPAAADKDET